MDEQINDGGPVYPQGMSLRDWFAGQAPECPVPMRYARDIPFLGDDLWSQLTYDQQQVYLAGSHLRTEAEHLARWAYAYADAMIAARKVKENEDD